MLDFDSLLVYADEQEHRDALSISENPCCSCFAVADGKSSHSVAELVIQTIQNDFQQLSEISTSSLPRIFQHAQEELSNFQQADLSPGLATTAVLLTDGAIALWGHIGDCRIYHLQDNLLYEITPDHSASYTRYEAGQLRYPKIRTDRLRQELTCAMGMEQNFSPAFSTPMKVRENDCFLICTDGFWENIHERQIERCLKHSKTASEWLKKMQKIVNKNRSRKKYTKIKDDFSAIVIKV